MTMCFSRRAALALPLAAVVVGVGTASAAFQDSLDSVFARTGDPTAGLEAFPRWRAVLQRHARKPWLGAERLARDVRALKSSPASTQLERVQALVARATFADDRETWGVLDFWATPGELLTWGGDCEDFAVAKYLALRELGWPIERLRVTLVQNEAHSPARQHAVLLVRVGDETLALDRTGAIVRPSALPFYRPTMSVNEQQIFLHGPV